MQAKQSFGLLVHAKARFRINAAPPVRVMFVMCIAQVLHLNNLTTEEQHVARRTWVRVPMTAQDHQNLFG